eukprot:Polyplicarium_translucidae@DN3290_c0_g1_i1.p2
MMVTVKLCLFLPGIFALKLHEWITSDEVPSDLGVSMRIANEEDLESLARDMRGLTLFLPTNSAWGAKRGWAEALIDDGNLRYEMMLASGAEVETDLSNGDRWKQLREFAKLNWNLVDSGYGTSYLLQDSQLCIAEFQGSMYVAKECGEIVLPPIALDDSTIYMIDSIMLPEELQEALDAAKEGASSKVDISDLYPVEEQLEGFSHHEADEPIAESTEPPPLRPLQAVTREAPPPPTTAEPLTAT